MSDVSVQIYKIFINNQLSIIKYCVSLLPDMEKREQDDSYRHVLKYTGLFGGVQGLKIFVNLLRNMLTARILGKIGMGLNAIYQNIAEFLNSCTNFGISFYAVQRISEMYERGTDDEIRRFVGVIRTWSVWSALLGGGICLFFASQLNAFYFPGQQHRLEIMLLSLYVASLPIEAVECSLLKGLRRLRTVAVVEVMAALSTFLLTIPLYYLMGIRGVVLSLVLCGWAVALIHLYFSTKLYRYRVRLFTRSVIREGWPLIRIGVPYVLAAVAGAATTSAIFSYLEDVGQVGLYRAGYNLMVIYAGMVFVAMEADFFPRLSSVNHDRSRRNHAINQQIDVCILLMAPILILFIIAMPWVVRLLYGSDFMAVVPMAEFAVFYMFFKSVTTPIAYMSLAKGDSWLYLIMECIYDVVFVLLMHLGYSHMGLAGAGVALSAAALFDLLMIGLVYGFYYHFRLRMETLRLILPQAVLLALVVLACLLFPTWLRYCTGFLCLALSLVFSWRKLTPELPLIVRLKSKILNR